MSLDGTCGSIERFRAFTMAHPHLMTARDELVDAIEGATPGSLVLVLGPTGVGKTTLRLKVEHLLLQQMAVQMAADPSRLPFVSVDVPPPHSGRFRWRDYFSRLLLAMQNLLSIRKRAAAPRTPAYVLTLFPAIRN